MWKYASAGNLQVNLWLKAWWWNAAIIWDVILINWFGPINRLRFTTTIKNIHSFAEHTIARSLATASWANQQHSTTSCVQAWVQLMNLAYQQHTESITTNEPSISTTHRVNNRVQLMNLAYQQHTESITARQRCTITQMCFSRSLNLHYFSSGRNAGGGGGSTPLAHWSNPLAVINFNSLRGSA